MVDGMFEYALQHPKAALVSAFSRRADVFIDGRFRSEAKRGLASQRI